MKLLLLVVVGALAAVALYSMSGGVPRLSSLPPGERSVVGPPPPTAAPGELSVEITEATLSEQVNSRLAGQSLGDTPLGRATLRGVSVKLQNGQMIASGDAQVGSATVPINVSGAVDLEAGRPVVRVHDATAAGVPLPDSTRVQLEQLMQAQVNQAVASHSMRVRSITIRDGKLLLVGAPA